MIDLSPRTPQSLTTSGGGKITGHLSATATLSIAVAFGVLLALAETFRPGMSEISLHLSSSTAIAFLTGFNPAFACLRFSFGNVQPTSQILRRAGLVVLIVIAAGAFLYPWRSLAADRFLGKFVGVGLALCFIAAGLTLVRRIVRDAEREEESQEAREHSHASDDPTPQEAMENNEKT